jgi:hypothetical protein
VAAGISYEIYTIAILTVTHIYSSHCAELEEMRLFRNKGTPRGRKRAHKRSFVLSIVGGALALFGLSKPLRCVKPTRHGDSLFQPDCNVENLPRGKWCWNAAGESKVITGSWSSCDLLHNDGIWFQWGAGPWLSLACLLLPVASRLLVKMVEARVQYGIEGKVACKVQPVRFPFKGERSNKLVIDWMKTAFRWVYGWTQGRINGMSAPLVQNNSAADGSEANQVIFDFT